jgi:SAM-dependent methyltransferase
MEPERLCGHLKGMPDSSTPAPYAFETVQRDSRGGELARLEAQNLLLEKQRPLDHLPPIPKAGRVLDVGSGSGFWAVRLAESVPDGEVVCLDRSPELLGHARARLEGAGFTHGRFLEQDLRNLDLEPGFDLIFTCVTLAHVEELEGTLQRLCSALRPGGWILCLEPLQNRDRLFNVHPPCPNLELLMDRMAEVARDRGSDLSVGLKIAHHLEALGLEQVTVRYFGEAAHGEDRRAWVEDIFLPIARTYLAPRLDPLELDSLVRMATAEAARPFTWADIKRAVVRGRKPGLGAETR